MQRFGRIAPALFLIAILLAVFGTNQQSAAYSTPRSGFGKTEVAGPVSLKIEVVSPVLQPGDTVDVRIMLENSTNQLHAPQLQIVIPPQLVLTSTQLPSGMTVNYQTAHLDWLPVLKPKHTAVFELQFKAATADIVQPEQAIGVTMTVDGETVKVDARFWLGIDPTVDKVLLPSRVAVGQPVQLRARLSGSGPFSQSWQLGDGRIVNVNDPTVSFPAAGEYTVILTVSNPLATVEKTQKIYVVAQPAAQFTVSDFSVAPNQPVQFVNQSGGQGPLETRWAFGDGTVSTETSPSHSYVAPGEYQVHLTVRNAHGRSEAYTTVTVGAPPTLQLVLPDQSSAGDVVTGKASGDSSVTRFQWDFGDGLVSDGSEVASIFNKPGTYFVSLTAYNQFGQSTTGQWITIGPGSFRSYLPIIFQPFVHSGGIVALGSPDLMGGAGETFEEVPLDEPFVMTPLALPATLSKSEQLLIYVNEARRQFGLRPLTEVAQLSAAAQTHATDMASSRFTGHVGSDGSAPIERFVFHQYGAEYAGEATAWGFEHPYEAVEFWVNSSAHRPIILNQYATDLGVGYKVDFRAPAVWYWTTEYGNRFGTAFEPTLRILQPLVGSQHLNSDAVTYGWVWAKTLLAGESFSVYATVGDEKLLLGETAVPVTGLYYAVTANLADLTNQVGKLDWHVELKNGTTTLLASKAISIRVLPDPTLPTVTPTAVPTETLPVATPTATAVTPIPTPTQPVVEPPPPLATATPDDQP